MLVVLLNYFKLNQDSQVTLVINDETFVITKNTTLENIDLKSLNTSTNTTLKIKCQNAQVKYHNKIIKNAATFKIKNINIQKDNFIKLELKLGKGNYQSLNINTLPSTFPEFSVEGKGTNGQYYVTTYNKYNKEKHYIYSLDNKGNITFYKVLANMAFNFKKQIIDNQVYYTYLETVNAKYEGRNDACPTKLIVLDENYQKIKEIMYSANINTENHDYYFWSLDHYIIGGYTKEEVTYQNKKYKIWDFHLKEVNNNQTIWEFNSHDNLYLIKYFSENYSLNNDIYVNFMHFNSLTIDPIDNNIICSFRNLDALLKINRQTGKIMWILGGLGDEFGLKDTQKFSKQHSISFLKTGELLIYDNGENNQQTRILKVKIDEKKKKVTSFKEYNLNTYLPRMGSIQALNEKDNIYLVTYGLGASKYAFNELNLETLEPLFNFKLKNNNSLFNVNKYN